LKNLARLRGDTIAAGTCDLLLANVNKFDAVAEQLAYHCLTGGSCQALAAYNFDLASRWFNGEPVSISRYSSLCHRMTNGRRSRLIAYALRRQRRPRRRTAMSIDHRGSRTERLYQWLYLRRASTIAVLTMYHTRWLSPREHSPGGRSSRFCWLPLPAPLRRRGRAIFDQDEKTVAGADMPYWPILPMYYRMYANVRLGRERRLSNGVAWRALTDIRTGRCAAHHMDGRPEAAQGQRLVRCRTRRALVAYERWPAAAVPKLRDWQDGQPFFLSNTLLHSRRLP
jgi:hypothetical protein